MSNPMSRSLQRTTAQTVETKIEDAIRRLQNAVSDSYDSISVLSIYWESDDAGGHEDGSLFIQTIAKLQNVQTHQYGLSDRDGGLALVAQVAQALPTGSRRLFILHYAGYGVPESLVIVPKIGQEWPQIDMWRMKEDLKYECSRSSGLDVLLVMNSCCAAIAGQGSKVKGARVELVAGAARKGLSNPRKDADGRTFTQRWCAAFTKLLDSGKPFTCDDINSSINLTSEPEKPRSFVLHEGWDLPITFSLRPGMVEPTLPSAVASRTVVVVFNVKEDPDSPALKQLMDYLGKTPVQITVLAAQPVSGTVLLLRVPAFLEELLVLPRGILTLAD